MGTRKPKEGRRMILRCALRALMALCLVEVIVATPTQGQGEKFPSRSVEVVVPYSAGGICDVVARILQDSISKELKVPFIIRNQPGGAGVTASAAYLNTKPDGYTVLVTSNGVWTAVHLSKTPPFDPRKDFLDVGYIGAIPQVMVVSKASPFKSFDDFFKYAKSNPGKLNGAIMTGLGSESHIMFMSILRDAKIESKLIPYNGVGQMVAALMGGHVDWAIQTVTSALPYTMSGDVRVLLLARRSSIFPDVPTGPDKGLPNVTGEISVGFAVHPKTPKTAYDRIVSAVEAATKNPEVAKKLNNLGFELDYKNPQESSRLTKDQWDSFSKFIEETGFKIE